MKEMAGQIVQEAKYTTKESAEAMSELTDSAKATGAYGEAYRRGESLKLKELRSDTIYRSARAYATQAGLYWRYSKINNLISTKYEPVLDQISFRPFIEQGVILIPSILESREERSLSNGVLTEVRASYYVDEEAEIVSEAPTFRDYLYREFAKPKELHAALQPKNDKEKEAWDKGSKEGWQLGIDQADEIFLDGFYEFEKDITGRITFLKMKALNMIGDAELRVNLNGITFNGRAMNVGEVLYTIDSPAQYLEMQGWRT